MAGDRNCLRDCATEKLFRWIRHLSKVLFQSSCFSHSVCVNCRQITGRRRDATRHRSRSPLAIGLKLSFTARTAATDTGYREKVCTEGYREVFPKIQIQKSQSLKTHAYDEIHAYNRCTLMRRYASRLHTPEMHDW